MRPVATVSVRQVGRPSLMVTLRTPKKWPRNTARWLRESVRPHLILGTPTDVNTHRSESTRVGLILGMLIGLTSLAVAQISLWWVPAYLALMVFIFVTPRARGRLEPQVVSVDKSAASIRNGSGQELRADQADEGVHTHLAPGSIASPMTSESVTEAGAGELDMTSSGMITPRRTRSRARKAAKPATEHVLEAALPTWVRVGPGKFIRASSSIQVIDQAQSEGVTAPEGAVSDSFVPEAPAFSTPADTLVMEQDSPDLPGMPTGKERRTVESDDSTLQSVTEVYGIAPSTFSSISSASSLAESLEEDIPDQAVQSGADCDPEPSVGSNLPPDGIDRRRLNLRESTSNSRHFRFSRGIANAIRRGDRASLRCNVRNGPKRRLPNRSFSGANDRHRLAAPSLWAEFSHSARAAPTLATVLLKCLRNAGSACRVCWQRHS